MDTLHRSVRERLVPLSEHDLGELPQNAGEAGESDANHPENMMAVRAASGMRDVLVGKLIAVISGLAAVTGMFILLALTPDATLTVILLVPCIAALIYAVLSWFIRI